jgi:carbon monoxide dehydrogenase subunit G
MDMTGEYRIPAPRAAVWAALNDVEVLKAAIPGCDSIQRLSDTEIEATVTAKIGPVKASFKGQVTLSDIDPPNGYTIRGEGKGGAAGFAKGGAKVRLADAGAETVLSYAVEASVGGKLAQIGARLIDSTAKKLADDFFAKFSALAAAKAAAPAPASDAQPAAQTPMTPAAPSVTVAPALPPEADQKPPLVTLWALGLLVLAMFIGLVVVGFLR